MAAEQVLVVPAAKLSRVLRDNGLVRGFEAETLEVIRSGGLLLPRPEAENNPEYRQPIPYVVLMRNGHAFLLRRTDKGGERRLHNLYSLGIGGHINTNDAGEDKIVENCLLRELHEEVTIEGTAGEAVLRGVINDGSNEVGSVHLGLFYTMQIEGSAVVRETEKHSGEWAAAAELRQRAPQMESWSQIILPAVIKLLTEL